MKDAKLSTQMTSMAVPNNGEAMHSSFDRLQKADEHIFTHVAGWHSELGDTVLPRLSIAASYSRLWIAISAVVGLTGGKESRRAVLEALTAVALSSAVVNIAAKGIAHRQRPTTTVPDSRALEHPSSSSFPSGHSASAAAFSGVMGHRLPAIAVPINAVAASVAFSRVYTGVHYPSDVAVGWAMGRIAARVVTLVSRRMYIDES
jgi:undecaprenyl-diphosphatase